MGNFFKNILSALLGVLIPPQGTLSFSCSELGLVEKIEEALSYLLPPMRILMKFSLGYFEFRALLFRLSFTRFSKMEKEQQKAYLHAWQHSRISVCRNMIRFLEFMAFTAYYSDERVGQALGFQTKLPKEKLSPSALYSPRVIVKIDHDESLEVDVCIVGSGAGGAPVAAELSQAGLRVVVLEEGGRFDLKDFVGDASERSRKMYRGAAVTPTLGTPPIIVPVGKTLGGTTTINSGTCFRTPEKIFQKWQSEYGLDICLQEMESYFEKVERVLHVQAVPEELLGNSAKKIRLAFEKEGIRGKPLLRNVKSCEGSGLCCFGCPTEAKQSVQLNYIPTALEHGAKFYTHMKVESLEPQGSQIKTLHATWTHPYTQEKGPSLRVRAKVFVLSAGTIHTPVLLAHSGLGRQSGELGKNLSLHPAGKTLALFDEEIRGWEGVPQSYYTEDFKDSGIMFEGIFTPPSLTATALLIHGEKHKEVMQSFSKLACYGFMITDESRGRVIPRKKGEPWVFYSLNQNDTRKFVEASHILCRLFFEAGAKEVYPSIHSKALLTSMKNFSPDEISRISAKDLEILAFHPLGTCRMGSNPAESVVDAYGKVHDMDNLFVADGSIFPSSLGVNPQISIMAFATRTAEHIRKNYF